jgi:hypothetical protein
MLAQFKQRLDSFRADVIAEIVRKVRALDSKHQADSEAEYNFVEKNNTPVLNLDGRQMAVNLVTVHPDDTLGFTCCEEEESSGCQGDDESLETDKFDLDTLISVLDEIGDPSPGTPNPPHEVAHILVLSTAHVKKKDAGLLDQNESPVACFNKQVNGESYGWWIHVSDPEDGFNSDAQILAARYSRAFIGLLHLARQLGCQWLMLDRDGPVRDDLPKFEW